MISKGRSVRYSNGLAGRVTKYLLHNIKNERATFIQAFGTAFPNDLEKSLDQMIMMGDLSKSDRPLYQAILSPDTNVDKELSPLDWERMRQIQAKSLGLENQPFIEVEHLKNGRVHRHYYYQRYDPETGCMVDDSFDYKAHAKAREQIEVEFGHERTFQRLSPERLKAKLFIENLKEVEQESEEDKQRKEIERRIKMMHEMREKHRKLVQEREQNKGFEHEL